MRTSIIIQLIGTFCQTAGAEYIVPAYIDEKNDWFVDVAISYRIQQVRMKLKMARYDTIPCEYPAHGPAHNLFSLLLFSLLGNVNGVHQPFSFESAPGRCAEGLHVGRLGVKPGSPLMAAAGSIAMIQLSQEGHAREGHLVIGSNYSSFNATCVTDSLMRFRIDTRFEGSITMGRLNTAVDSIGFDLLPDTVLAWVPDNIVAFIIEALEGMGARRLSHMHSTTFTNCTREVVVASLPPIEVTRENFGTLLLYPDEYIEYESDGHCSLLLQSPWEGAVVFQVDIMKLPNINVRIANTGIVEFCDAILDPDYVGLHHPADMTNVSTVIEEPVSHSLPSSSVVQPITEPPTQRRLQRFARQLRRIILARLRIR
jgi:hypothetical protein